MAEETTDKTTNYDVYKEVVECTNMLLKETANIRTSEAWIIDHLEPTYNNSRNIHLMVFELTETIKKMDNKINSLISIVNDLDTKIKKIM